MLIQAIRLTSSALFTSLMISVFAILFDCFFIRPFFCLAVSFIYMVKSKNYSTEDVKSDMGMIYIEDLGETSFKEILKFYESYDFFTRKVYQSKKALNNRLANLQKDNLNQEIDMSLKAKFISSGSVFHVCGVETKKFRIKQGLIEGENAQEQFANNGFMVIEMEETIEGIELLHEEDF